jgi:hypothetical protein
MVKIHRREPREILTAKSPIALKISRSLLPLEFAGVFSAFSVVQILKGR